MYHNFKEWFALAEEKHVSLARVVLENEIELTGLVEEEVYIRLAERWIVMKTSANKALEEPQEMPGNLIRGQAQKQNEFSEEKNYTGYTVNKMMALAFSSSEVNAAMGRICASPTAGACGILPAVMLTTIEKNAVTEQEVLEGLLVAAGVGAIVTQNATVSGAEGGCQAECGTAAAMASAAAVFLAGGTAEMVGNAVSISLMNCMGLVCDPVAGMVQLPCSFRNASQSVNALISADMALAGQQPWIPPDEVVESMFKVGKSMAVELRETALGGIATTPTGISITKKLSSQQSSALQTIGAID